MEFHHFVLYDSDLSTRLYAPDLSWCHKKVIIDLDSDNKMSANQIDEVGSKLLALKQFIPSIFARKPQKLSDINRWKATELRHFLIDSTNLINRATYFCCRKRGL